MDRLLSMLRDPGVESRDLAAAAGTTREEADRAARLVRGIDAAAPGEIASLPGSLAAAAARAALAAGRADVLAALAAHAEKEVAKEAKRGLHLLRSRGVAVPEPPRSRPAAAPAPPDLPLPAYASAVDVGGEQVIWIARGMPGKGIEVAQAVLSDTDGLVELEVGVVGRKEWRQLVSGLLERGETLGVGSLPRERALGLVRAARARNEASGRPVPQDADPWLAQQGPAPEPPDPAGAFPPLAAGEEADALAASAHLHELPLLRSWLADEAFLRGLAVKLDEVAVSPLYIDERQRAEQMERVLSDGVDAYFDAARRRLLSSRLFRMAEHLAERGDPAHARAAAAAARALAGGTPPSAVPFARLLVEKAFPPRGPSPEAAALGPEAPSPLILSPR